MFLGFPFLPYCPQPNCAPEKPQVLPEPATGADACCRVCVPHNMALIKAVILKHTKEVHNIVSDQSGLLQWSDYISGQGKTN